MNALMIAATERSAGKSVLIAALAAYWQRYCSDRPLAVMKLVETQAPAGDRPGLELPLHQLPSVTTPFSYASSLVPPLAAKEVGDRIKLEELWQTFEALADQNNFVLMEGAESLGTPITPETTEADLAWDWRLPVILVVPVKPGAIAQASAYAALATQARVHLKGIILNCVEPCSEEEILNWASPRLIQSLTHRPVLGWMPHLSPSPDLEKLVQVASNLKLEYLLPLPLILS